MPVVRDTKIAIVCFSLGGPDSLDAVEPFLFNLFNDPAIIRVPGPIRWLLARLISKRRTPQAREIYAQIGGRSPLLEETDAQARALEARLASEGLNAKVFVSMRYWHPMSVDVARSVAAWAPDEVILLPLYPQYSTTTSQSSLSDWDRAAGAAGLRAPSFKICCYPTDAGWISAQADLIRKGWAEATTGGRKTRLLFSAHGLPKKVVADGDPYQWQVEQTAAALVDRLQVSGLDWTICYQSRVGPLEWIGPSTEEEIVRAGRDGCGVVIVPLAFVSEHSETLVELDIEYRELAEENGVASFVRVPTVGTHPEFIAGLSDIVKSVRTHGSDWSSGLDCGRRVCPASFRRCPNRPPEQK